MDWPHCGAINLNIQVRTVQTAANLHAECAANPNLRYLLVHDWMPSLGGSESVFEQICSLFPGPVVTSIYRQELFPWLEEREVRSSAFGHAPPSLFPHYLFSPWMPGFYQGVDTSDADVVLVDSHSFAHHVRRSAKAVLVCYYHTTARSLWNPEIDDRATRGKFAWIRKQLASALRDKDLEASKNPQYLIANSQTTAGRILKHYGRQVDEIIYPPVSIGAWLDTPRLDDSEGFLMWGRLIGYKRIDLAIRAAQQTGFRLNVVGAGPDEQKLKRMAAGSEQIRFHGRLPESELKRLISQSKALLFPGYEDFGIVPVEAMAAGLPVIAYGQGGAAESVGEHGLILHSQDVDELAERMRQIQAVHFEPEQLRAAAAQFDVSVFRERYCGAVQRAVEKLGSRLRRHVG